MSKDKAIEAKVGALVLFSIALLVGFVMILGDFSFSESYKIHVDFDNAGGLKPGAEVAIAGLDVGTVEDLEFIRPGKRKTDEKGVSVRATLQIRDKYTDDIRENSDFFITRPGVLGEPYIEIETPSLDAPAVEEGMVLMGTEPPRMDVIISKATDLLDSLTNVLKDPDTTLSDLIGNTAALTGNLNRFLEQNSESLNTTVQNTESATNEAASVLSAVDNAVGNGTRLDQILQNSKMTAKQASSVSTQLNKRLPSILENVDKGSQTARNLLQKNQTKLNKTITNTEKLSGDARKVVHRLESGKGTVGRLLADREIYDNMKELMRVLKKRPWKIIWKE